MTPNQAARKKQSLERDKEKTFTRFQELTHAASENGILTHDCVTGHGYFFVIQGVQSSFVAHTRKRAIAYLSGALDVLASKRHEREIEP